MAYASYREIEGGPPYIVLIIEGCSLPLGISARIFDLEILGLIEPEVQTCYFHLISAAGFRMKMGSEATGLPAVKR